MRTTAKAGFETKPSVASSLILWDAAIAFEPKIIQPGAPGKPSANIDAEDAKSQALNSENVQRYLDGNDPLKVIYVAGRIVNIVV